MVAHGDLRGLRRKGELLRGAFIPTYFNRVKLFVGQIGGTFHQLQSELPRRHIRARRGQVIRVASCACGHDFGLSYRDAERESAYAAHIEAMTATAKDEK